MIMNNFTIRINKFRTTEILYVTKFNTDKRAIETSVNRDDGKVFLTKYAAEQYMKDVLSTYTRDFFEIVKVKFQVILGRENMI